MIAGGAGSRRIKAEDTWPNTTTAGPLPRSRFAEALRPLASRPYRLMWMGSTTSSIGDAVVQIALVFAILHIGGTASDIGVIAAV